MHKVAKSVDKRRTWWGGSAESVESAGVVARGLEEQWTTDGYIVPKCGL